MFLNVCSDYSLTSIMTLLEILVTQTKTGEKEIFISDLVGGGVCHSNSIFLRAFNFDERKKQVSGSGIPYVR